jgi:hypothetical protein
MPEISNPAQIIDFFDSSALYGPGFCDSVIGVKYCQSVLYWL